MPKYKESILKNKAYTYWGNDNTFYQWQPSELQQTLTLEDWLSMNANLGLTRIDSKYAVLYQSPRITLGDYRLYELRYLNPIRTNSLRFLMDQERENIVLLAESNGPIYTLWENLVKKYPDNKQLLFNHNPEKITEEILLEYVKFFFANVIGKHGPFHLIESLEDIKSRANNHYNLHPEEIAKQAYTAEQWEEALTNCLSLYRHHDILEEKQTDEQTQEETIKSYTLLNILMVFKATLFKANISITTAKDNYGLISLSNESSGNIAEDPDQPGKYKIFFYLNAEEQTGETNLPVFP